MNDVTHQDGAEEEKRGLSVSLLPLLRKLLPELLFFPLLLNHIGLGTHSFDDSETEIATLFNCIFSAASNGLLLLCRFAEVIRPVKAGKVERREARKLILTNARYPKSYQFI